ncbi:hypothetical protein [Williamwhitmania taraxaci]|nr:hypothetical protein [Williamwhitmania taraxaci]
MKEYFAKKVVKIEYMESEGGGSSHIQSFCVINKKKIIIYGAYEEEVEVDKHYYVWYNTKTEKVYLTDRKSQRFDASGRLWHLILVELVSIFITTVRLNSKYSFIASASQ